MTTDINQALYAFRKFGDTVLRAAYACCGNYAESEDITQDIFLLLHAKPQSFADDEHLKAWLLRVTVNKCKNLPHGLTRDRGRYVCGIRDDDREQLDTRGDTRSARKVRVCDISLLLRGL